MVLGPFELLPRNLSEGATDADLLETYPSLTLDDDIPGGGRRRHESLGSEESDVD